MARSLLRGTRTIDVKAHQCAHARNLSCNHQIVCRSCLWFKLCMVVDCRLVGPKELLHGAAR